MMARSLADARYAPVSASEPSADGLRVVDLFAGIGMFSLGLERTGGFQTVASCEIDPAARRVLAKHWPAVPCAPDIKTRVFTEGEADVLTGGFPCQDVSSARRKPAGLAGARSGLWREMLRAIRVVRPLYAIVENVAALRRRGLDKVLGDLAEIRYDAEWHCIPASALGAPHERDRTWIATYPAQAQRASVFGWRDLARQHRLLAQRAEDASRAAEFPEATWHHPWREVADRLGKLDDGVSRGFRGFDGLANAVVPQIPELIGRAILAARQAKPATGALAGRQASVASASPYPIPSQPQPEKDAGR